MGEPYASKVTPGNMGKKINMIPKWFLLHDLALNFVVVVYTHEILNLTSPLISGSIEILYV